MAKSRFSNRKQGRSLESGFTLVELVVVMILVGILAAVAIPRLNTRVFDTTGFFDEVQATVRFAQKDAIAKRRNVCLTFAAGSLTLTYSPSELAPAACTANLVSPRGVTPFSVTAPTGVTLTATSNFRFDGLGRPSAGPITVTVTGDGVRTFIVQSETGYVQ